MVTYLSKEPGCRDVYARESTMRTCYPPGHVAPHNLKSFVNIALAGPIGAATCSAAAGIVAT